MGIGADTGLLRWLGAGAAALLFACRPEATPDRASLPNSVLEVPVAAPPAPAAASAGSPDPGRAPPASVPGTPIGREPRPNADRVAFDFEDADLPELVRLVGGITGKRFILTGKLPAVHATVHSPAPVTPDEAYGAFLSILEANGLTVVQSGGFWKILPSPGLPIERGAGR